MKSDSTENVKWSQSVTVKIIVLTVSGLLLLIPLVMIQSIIKERQKSSEDVKKEISLQWAGQQTISGPVLNIPVVVFSDKKDSEYLKIIYHILPENLLIKGEIKTEKRHRSIYQAVVYNSSLNLSGDFVIPVINPGTRYEILYDEAYYSLGISDNRGLKGNMSITTDSIEKEAIPGIRDNDLFLSGITFPADNISKTMKTGFSISMNLSGSENLNFLPLGKITKVELSSSWNSPGFTGNFLPVTRKIDDKGFYASWLITNLNRNFPQIWSGSEYNVLKDSFGVDFVLMADHYQKSLRSAKYGILFIALTFLSLFFTEFTGKVRINIFHYLLLALGLVLFFSLLNALSEQVGFNLAYLIASISTIGMISMFLKAIIGQIRPVLLISVLLLLLYTFIFILLSLNDYAYLAGNIGLFILLAVTMKISLKLRAESEVNPLM
jgi:inner membrane protein